MYVINLKYNHLLYMESYLNANIQLSPGEVYIRNATQSESHISDNIYHYYLLQSYLQTQHIKNFMKYMHEIVPM